MITTHMVKLDRPRTLRLTHYALKRLQDLYGGRSLPAAIAAVREETGLTLISRYIWLFAVDQDRALTPDKMEGIIAGWLGAGFLPLRIRKLNKLEAVVRQIVQEFQQEEKDHGR